MSTRALIACPALLFALLGAIGNSPAQERDWNRFRVSLGAFIVDYDTSVRVDSSSGRGTAINLEDDLGMDPDETILVGSFRYRFARKHSLALSYMRIDRDGQLRLSRDIRFGEDTFTVGLHAETFFKYDLVGLSYRYAFVQKPRFDLAFSVGVSAIDYNLGVTGKLDRGARTLREVEDEEYPVPTFGLGGAYRFGSKWALRSGFGYFSYGQDDWDAFVLIVDVDLEYFPWKHIGFGLGYNYFEIRYEEEGDDSLDITYEYDGILFRALFEF